MVQFLVSSVYKELQNKNESSLSERFKNNKTILFNQQVFHASISAFSAAELHPKIWSMLERTFNIIVFLIEITVVQGAKNSGLLDTGSEVFHNFKNKNFIFFILLLTMASPKPETVEVETVSKSECNSYSFDYIYIYYFCSCMEIFPKKLMIAKLNVCLNYVLPLY